MAGAYAQCSVAAAVTCNDLMPGLGKVAGKEPAQQRRALLIGDVECLSSLRGRAAAVDGNRRSGQSARPGRGANGLDLVGP